MGAQLKITNLRKTFVKNGQRIDVLRGVNLTIKNGESIAIVGVSGAGKTTLIHILGTIERPTSGTVEIDGIDVFSWGERELASFRNRKIGFIFQFFNLLPEFTSLENVMMPALLGGLSRREAKIKAELILNEVGLGDRMTHKPGELSGGEQQRVAVARALIMDPDIVLADEPTGNLDTRTGGMIEELLLDLNIKRKVTLIVVTHNRKLASKMSRMIDLVDGRIADE